MDQFNKTWLANECVVKIGTEQTTNLLEGSELRTKACLFLKNDEKEETMDVQSLFVILKLNHWNS